jgi:putative membrane protein
MISKPTLSRIFLYPAIALLSATAAVAQAHPGGGASPAPSQQQQNGVQRSDDAAPSQQDLADRDFVKKALQGGDVEVQLGQLAQQKSQSDDVKEFAQKMVSDHTQMGDQLMKPLAKQIHADIPKGLSKKDKQLVAKLETLSGPQFDEEYIKAMVKDHKDDLKEFKSEEESTQNPNVKQAVQQGEAVISKHLQLIEQIAQTHNITADAK